MAERGDDVLSLSDREDSAMSDFSGFEPLEATAGPSKSDDVKTECHKSKENSRGSTKAKPWESIKGKNKISSKNKEKSSSAKKAASKQPDNSVFGVENLTQEVICQLRELLGYNNQEIEVLSVFERYSDRPDNLIIERNYDSPLSEIENIQEQPARSLDKQLKDALFSDTQSKGNDPESLANDDFAWQLPKLKIPKKGEAVSASLASLINTTCTSQCEADEIISKYKIPSNCDKMGPPSVNPEIWKDIIKKAQTYDKAFQDIQTLISIGMVPIIKLVGLMNAQLSDEAKSSISDAITLFGQAQFNISLRRRYMIRPFLKKKYSSLCSIQTPITFQLFGDDLNKEIKKCDTSVSVARENFGSFSYRGQNQGCARGRGGYSYFSSSSVITDNDQS